METKIYEATGRDLPSILALYTHLGMDDGSILTLKEAKRIFNRIKTYPDYKLYIARVDEEIVGTFALIIMDNIGHMGALSGIVEDVVVHPDYRRKGIGRRMMEFAMDYCRKKGCYKMTLSSNLNRIDAHRFYRSLGFKKHGYSFLIAIEGGQQCQ
jgi:GNAT superfamily N-acetyltransferase